MPDVEWVMDNCHMMQDNGVWAGEKQISYASPDGQYTYYVNSCRQIACQLDRPLHLIRAVVYHYKIPVGKEEIQQHPWNFDNDIIFMRRS